MYLLIQLLLNAGVLFLLTYIMPSIKVRDYGTALAVALVIGILNATIGFLLRLPLNILTLGLLHFFVRLLVTAVMIKIADKLFKDFEVRTFSTALVAAIVMAIAGTLFSYII